MSGQGRVNKNALQPILESFFSAELPKMTIPANPVLKAKILKVGKVFNLDGQNVFVDWSFDCSGGVTGFDVGLGLVGGYTFEELKKISGQR